MPPAVMERERVADAKKCQYDGVGPECRNPVEWEWNGIRILPVLLCQGHKEMAELGGRGALRRIAEARS